MKIPCVECSEDIPEARLRARPGTRICVSCQQEKEKAGKFTKHRMEIRQELEGWQYAGHELVLIRKEDY